VALTRVTDSSPSSQPSADGEPKPIPLKPSRNQKQRSRLTHGGEHNETPAPAPQPAAEPSPAPAQPATSDEGDARLIRRLRLKRSGHMHEDLTALPEKPKRDDLY
jgi:hypothetical protein